MSNARIAGSGSIAGGEYEKVSISGAGSCTGDLRCTELYASGACKLQGELYCSEHLHASGAFHIFGSAQAKKATCSGSSTFEKDLSVTENAVISGACRVSGKISVQGKLEASGSFSVGGDIEAEQAVFSGRLSCDGLLNAETVSFRCNDRESKVGSIGCGKLDVRKTGLASIKTSRFIRLFRTKEPGNHILTVKDSIEGDEIYLEYVKAARVSGRRIVLGENCEIGSIQYSESLEGNPVGACVIEKTV